ncbi:hypothetical protein EJB05_04438 [Eragrostis curvula]|uniref:Uncharacterized protein n=1 Tax=Eragrostis curvula TaxID=38414 RepID=A0A5J9WAH9_9POAL|nr:hypothetical protein EJB05_04438 [Eragrostis curvula]
MREHCFSSVKAGYIVKGDVSGGFGVQHHPIKIYPKWLYIGAAYDKIQQTVARVRLRSEKPQLHLSLLLPIGS